MDKTKFHFSKKDTAEIMGITVVALGQWKLTGDFKKGTQTFFDIRKVVDHRIGREDRKTTNLTTERARLARIQGDKAEQEMAVRSGELCLLSEVGEHWTDMVMALRAKLLAMPPRIALAAIDASSVKQIEDVTTEMLYEALEELSNDGIPTQVKKISEGNSPEAKATTKINSKPVGRQVPKTKPRGKRRARAVENK